MAKDTEIGNYVRTQISILAKNAKTLEQSGSKAQLANLRRGIGKKPGELPELWGMFLKNLPEEFMGKNGKPSYAEWAVYTSLTLFALHQQGHSKSMHLEGEEHRFGRAVRMLCPTKDDRESEENIRRKLSIAAGADDIEALSYHLKTIVKLLANQEILLDYVDLAKDLYWFQFENHADRVRLKWGQDFYRNGTTNDNRRKEEEK